MLYNDDNDARVSVNRYDLYTASVIQTQTESKPNPIQPEAEAETESET